jgi:DNA primase
MRFTPEILDAIRSRVPVSQVAGRKVSLVRAGREWKGLSPFQQERTPSFFVNDPKQFYHCFSSGRHGDVFTFLMETEGLTFPEAVEALAAEAEVELPDGPAEAYASRGRRREILDALEAASTYFRHCLQDDEGEGARAFLDGRGVDVEARSRFGIGYAPPGWDRLRDHLIGIGFDDETLAEAGLVGGGPKDLSVFDRFRDRIMLPIADAAGRIVGFGARSLSDEGPAKYVNTPETAVFRKGALLYNFDKARAASDRSTPLLVVEGYLDAIALDSAGRPRTVSPMGTALTREQLAAAWRLDDEPILCFDGDRAGRAASDRAIDVALGAIEPGRSVRIAMLPEGRDPDAIVRDAGVGIIDAAASASETLVDALWRRETDGDRDRTPEGRAGSEARLRSAVARIRHPIVRHHYLLEIEHRFGASSPSSSSGDMRTDPIEISVLAILDAHPEVAAGFEAAVLAAGLDRGGASPPCYDPDSVAQADAWALDSRSDPADVRALLGELLRILGRRAVSRCEAVLDAAAGLVPHP